jgi:photosystem II stability/assembly factor-like uncharacterized protein
MDKQLDPETLYAQAQEAIAAGHSAHASDLLKQILQIDEDYRDAAQLLAEIVSRQRRRWYDDLRLWGGLGALAVITTIILLRGPSLGRIAPPRHTETPTAARAASTASPIKIPTSAISISPTPISLHWKRLSQGLSFSRDNIQIIVFDPEDPDVIYVGLNNAGVYKSIDGGISWFPTHNGLARATIVSLTMDPRDSRILYAGTAFGGPFRTTNGGDSWHPIHEGIDTSEMAKLQVRVDPYQGDHLYAPGGPSLYESFDQGESWNKIQRSGCPDFIPFMNFDPIHSQKLYAVGACQDQNGVYISEDGGRTWTLSMLEEGVYVEPYSFLVIDSTGDTLYATAWSEEYKDQLYVSYNGGQTWNRTDLDDSCSSLIIHPEDANIAYCTTRYDGRLVKTKDGGQSWQVVRQDMVGFGGLSFGPEGGGTLFLSGDGLFVSSDGGSTWVERSDGLGSGYLEFTLDPRDPSVSYVQDASSRLFRSEDQGRNWTVISEEGVWLAFDADGSTLYRLGEIDRAGFLMISRDRGETWLKIDTPTSRLQGFGTNPHREGTVFVYSQQYDPHLYISTDYGQSWEAIESSEGLFRPMFYFDQDQGERVYAVSRSFVISRSENGGWGWSSCGETVASISSSTTRLAIDPSDPDQIYLATSGSGLLASLDGCRSWENKNEGLANLFVNTIGIDPVNPDTMYAGTDGGAYVSFDGGRSWDQINDGLLGATVVYSIVVDPQSNVYAATPYGIFKLEGR